MLTLTRLTDIESGYAKVMAQPPDGAEFHLGSVREVKAGSTRTGTVWQAVYLSGRVVGTAYTRAAAVHALLKART